MSHNISTMPGCAGDYENPILEWVWKGLTCKECAWEAQCKEYTDERMRKGIYDATPKINIQVQSEITE